MRNLQSHSSTTARTAANVSTQYRGSETISNVNRLAYYSAIPVLSPITVAADPCRVRSRFDLRRDDHRFRGSIRPRHDTKAAISRRATDH